MWFVMLEKPIHPSLCGNITNCQFLSWHENLMIAKPWLGCSAEKGNVLRQTGLNCQASQSHYVTHGGVKVPVGILGIDIETHQHLWPSHFVVSSSLQNNIENPVPEIITLFITFSTLILTVNTFFNNRCRNWTCVTWEFVWKM